jgi:hypothetical protein
MTAMERIKELETPTAYSEGANLGAYDDAGTLKFLLRSFRVMREIAIRVYVEANPLENIDGTAIAKIQIDGEFEKRMREG